MEKISSCDPLTNQETHLDIVSKNKQTNKYINKTNKQTKQNNKQNKHNKQNKQTKQNKTKTINKQIKKKKKNTDSHRLNRGDH